MNFPFEGRPPGRPVLPAGAILPAALGLLFLVLLAGAAFSSVYTVQPEERGVVKRFGAVTGITGPGLNFKLPFGVDRVRKVPTERVMKEEFGFRSLPARARRLMPELGIELGDVRIKRVNYIQSVRQQVENRMISERQSIAERFRAEGQGRSQEILGEMARELRRIESEAAREAEEIRGRADAEAARIYGEAYGEDPEFFAFFRTLETYRRLGSNTTLMLRSDSDFFRYLERAGRNP